MAYSFALLIVLSLSYTSAFEDCGIPIHERMPSKIVNGHLASEGTWPWMVAITREGTEDLKVHCSGFLIDRRHIITAGHCFKKERNPILFSVMVGSVDLKTAIPYDVKSIVVHEEFRPEKAYHDIAIMKLYDEVNLDYAVPICLPTGNSSGYDFDGEKAVLAGYGRILASSTKQNSEKVNTEDYSFQRVTRLYELVNMPVISNIKCSEFYPVHHPAFHDIIPLGITESHICAGFPKGGKGTCVGDSGSPLMYEYQDRWYAIGVTSFAFGIVPCLHIGKPIIHTRITTHLDWIEFARSEEIDDFKD